MKTIIELVGVTIVNHTDKFIEFYLHYKEKKQSIWSRQVIEKSFKRLCYGNVLENMAQSIISRFADDGTKIWELDHGLDDNVTAKIRLILNKTKSNYATI